MRWLLLLCLGGCVAADPAPPPLRDTLPEASALAEQAWQRWDPAELSFDWQQTVLAWGMQRGHAASSSQRFSDYYRAWLNAALAERFDEPGAQPFRSSDSMSPTSVAALALAEDPAAGYEPMLDAAEAYLADARRTPEGAVQHWGPEHLFGEPLQVWVDSLFMVGMYLVARYEQDGDPAWLERWATQYRAFSTHCRDPEAGLYRHAWDEDAGVNIPVEATFWARGNSWVLVSAAAALRAGGDEAALDGIAELFAEHADAVRATQTGNGLYRTVLNSPQGDDPLNYEETSASALITWALHVGLEAGALDEGVAESVQAGLDGVLGRIVVDDAGHHELLGTSLGTNPGDYDYYLGISTLSDQLVGVGATIALLAELHGSEQAP